MGSTATLEQRASSFDTREAISAREVAELGVMLGKAIYDISHGVSPAFRSPFAWSLTRSDLAQHATAFWPIIAKFLQDVKANNPHADTYKLEMCMSYDALAGQKKEPACAQEIAQLGVVLGREGAALKATGSPENTPAWDHALERIVDQYSVIFQPTLRKLLDDVRETRLFGSVYGLDNCISN